MNHPLPERLRHALERLSGYDLRHVRVHPNSQLPVYFGANAFAYGENIFLQRGAESALAHEAWHVVQQLQGRVRATTRVLGIGLNDDAALEREAEQMGRVAKRLSLECARFDRPCPSVRSRSWLPVVQCQTVAPRPAYRQRFVRIGNNTILTPEALRDKLKNFYNLDTRNTPYLVTVVAEFFNARRTFNTLEEIKREVKRRDFGLRHVEALSDLRRVQEAEVDDYMEANNILTREDMDTVATQIGTSGRARVVRRAARNARNFGNYPPLTFLRWTSASLLRTDRAVGSYLPTKPMYRWVTRQPLHVEPLNMNCWETVLYSGAWNDGGRRRRTLYNRDYCLWALICAERDNRTFELRNAAGIIAVQPICVPRFVSQIIDNPVLHTRRTDADAVQNKPAIPTGLVPGMIVVFNCGAHVALYTGNSRPKTEQADRIYGPGQGHEIIELDLTTLTVETYTIEDVCAYRNLSFEIHAGWLPEVPDAVDVDFHGTHTPVAATHFFD